MSTALHYFFLDREIIIHRIINSMNMAKVSYIESSELFFVDLNFIFTECKQPEFSLSLAVLGGIVR